MANRSFQENSPLEIVEYDANKQSPCPSKALIAAFLAELI
jgi:hypothetical protein